MLKTIDPLLTPELLFVLAAMGHGDEIAIVDANFPADSVAGSTCYGRVVSLPGASMPEVVDAILSVLPLDDYVAAPVRTMAATTTAWPRSSKRFRRSSTPTRAATRRWESWSGAPFTRPHAALTPSYGPVSVAFSAMSS